MKHETMSAICFGAGTTAHQPRSGGRSQNRLHVQKALMEYLLLGKIAS
ncbi:MAG: hypothetical protein Q8K61_12180 [Gallionella sp.]|jgi:hypothetical protein|nr:hypothetical protein [Gallionella sp.]